MMATLVDAATITRRQEDSSADDMVTLDVRGTLFPTKKSTLLKVKGSYFDAMLTGHWPANDKGIYRACCPPNSVARLYYVVLMLFV